METSQKRFSGNLWKWCHWFSFSVCFHGALMDSFLDFPSGAVDKESSCQCRKHKRCESNPWIGKILWRRKWQPAPYSLSGNPMHRGAWWATVHRVAKSSTCLSTHIHPASRTSFMPSAAWFPCSLIAIWKDRVTFKSPWPFKGSSQLSDLGRLS